MSCGDNGYMSTTLKNDSYQDDNFFVNCGPGDCRYDNLLRRQQWHSCIIQYALCQLKILYRYYINITNIFHFGYMHAILMNSWWYSPCS